MLKSEKVELRRRRPIGGESRCSDGEGEAKEAPPRSREASSMVVERRRVCPGGPEGEPDEVAELEGKEKDVVMARGEVGRPGVGDRDVWACCGSDDTSWAVRVSIMTCHGRQDTLGSLTTVYVSLISGDGGWKGDIGRSSGHGGGKAGSGCATRMRTR